MNVKELKELLSKFNDSDEVYIEWMLSTDWRLYYDIDRMKDSDIYSDERWVIFRVY